MSQHSLEFDNEPRTTIRGDMQDAVQAVASCAKGPDEPANKYAGMYWIADGTPSTTVWTLRRWSGSAWIDVALIDSINGTETPIAGVTLSMLAGLIGGWTYGNGGADPANDIDIAAGRGIDDTAAKWIAGGAMTKRLDAAWAAGSGSGGLDVDPHGSPSDGDYHAYSILKSLDGSVDYLFSASATAPTMPADYDYKRRMGWFKREGGAISAFKTYERAGGGLEFAWLGPKRDVNGASMPTGPHALETLRVPTAYSVEALLHVLYLNANIAGAGFALLCSPDESDRAVNSGDQVPNLAVGVAMTSGGQNAFNVYSGHDRRVRTNVSGQVAHRASQSSMTITISTTGFIWSRR